VVSELIVTFALDFLEKANTLSEYEEKNIDIFIGSVPFLWYNACSGGADE
jgi:hypothetical protein